MVFDRPDQTTSPRIKELRHMKKAQIPRINDNQSSIPDNFTATPGGFLSSKVPNRHQKSVGNVSKRYEALSR